MVSSLLRRISQKAAANVRELIDPSKNSLLRTCGLIESKNARISSSPWLMLPPSFKGNDTSIMSFNFYSFSEDRVKRVFIKRTGLLLTPLAHIHFVSSSHGWLALFNKRNWDLFLFNPLSGGRQIKLPSIKPLIDGVKGVKRLTINKLITSCSPEEEECRIVMDFGGPSLQKVAFCSPSSGKWTEIRNVDYNEPTDDDDDPYVKYFDDFIEDDPSHRKYYNDFIYSTNHKRFYSVTDVDPSSTLAYLEAWDLQDTESPNIVHEVHQPCNPVGGAKSEDEVELKKECRIEIFLVMAEECGDLFWVRRYVLPFIDIDGSYCVSQFDCIDRELTYKTIGFDVHKYDIEKGTLVYMDGSLDGLALFIGNNNSFAVSASDFPELQPDSIYFTDNNESTSKNRSYGGHDIGIFNYENKSFSPTCYYPCDSLNLMRIKPPPMWFTPTY